MVDDRGVHGWDAGVHGHLFPLNDIQYQLRLAGIRCDDQLCTAVHGEKLGHRQSVNVEERDRAEYLFAAVFHIPVPGLQLLNIGAETSMGQHGRLGHAGCAASILEENRIVRAHVDGGRPGRVCVDEIVETPDAGTIRDIDHHATGPYLSFHKFIEREAQGIGDIRHNDMLEV